MTRDRLLLVEDDELLGTTIQLNLDVENKEVTWVKDGTEAQELALDRSFDLILLDIALPGSDGLAILQALRQAGVSCPVLMLTARGDLHTKVWALQQGADDYLTKPFELPELLARVEALLRRARAERQTPANRRLHFGRYEVNLETREAFTRTGRVVLSEREVALLDLLARAGGRPLSRLDILDEVWGMDTFPTVRTVDNFFLRLRKLFEEDPKNPRYLLTVRGLGYRLALD